MSSHRDMDVIETSYGSMNHRSASAIEVDSDIDINLNRNRKSMKAVLHTFIVSVTLGMIVFFVYISTSSSSSSSVSKSSSTSEVSAEDSSAPANVWTVYKHTTSVSIGMAEDVYEFVNKHVTYARVPQCLGCTSNKVVGELGGFEFHFVDSDIFHDNEKTVGDWADYVTKLGVDSPSPFFYNKVQMYVPNLAYHYNVSMGKARMLRKSMSWGSSTYDTAHIQLPIPYTSIIADITGPLDPLLATLSDSEGDEFKVFDANECSELQRLPYNLDEMDVLYTAQAADTEVNGDWGIGGRYLPLGVHIVDATNSLPKAQSTMELVRDVTGYGFEIGTSGICKYIISDLDGLKVSYWQNDALSADNEILEEWEESIMDLHNEELDMNKPYAWDRYLDTHIGIYAHGDTDAECDSYISSTTEVVERYRETSDLRYAMRDSGGVHFYTAPYGLRTWEFNAFGCSSNFTQICGCMPSNSYNDLVEVEGITVCTGAAIQD